MAFAGGYIDLTTGNTYFFPSPMNGSSYYNSKGSVATFLPQIYADKRSSLIVLLGSREFSEVDGLDDYGLHYYQMKGDKMVYIKSILLKDALRGSGSKM